HLAIYRRDLVWQRIDKRSMHRQARVEQVGHADAVRLGDQAKEAAIAIETPRRAGGDDLQGGFAVTVEQFIAELAGAILVGEFGHHVAVPLYVDDGDEAVR